MLWFWVLGPSTVLSPSLVLAPDVRVTLMAVGAKKSGALVVAVGFMFAASTARALLRAQDRNSYASGTCEREGQHLTGAAPVVVRKSGPRVKKVRNVPPKYPDLPSGTVGSGPWAGEILVGLDGSVVRVWTIREVQFKPPFQPFNHAIVEAIQQWRFEPFRVRTRATPVCLPVTITIDWS